MTQPVDHRLDGMKLAARWQGRSRDHDDGQAEFACRHQLGARAIAAGILGNDDLDGMFVQKRPVRFDRERSAIDDDAVTRQGRRRLRLVDEAQQIMVLRLRGEGGEVLTPERQHHASGGTGKGSHRFIDIRYIAPVVARFARPWRARQGDKRYAGLIRGFAGIGAHRGGEGMGRIDQMRDSVRLQKMGEPFRPAETADAHRDGLGAGICDPSGIAQHRRHAGIGERGGESTGLARAAENEDVGHG